MHRLVLAALSMLAFVGPVHAACGDADNPCTVDQGSYHIMLAADGHQAGTIIHLHGGGASGKGMLKSGLANEASKRGYAFIAPNGEHPNNRWTKDWSVRSDGYLFERNDMAFIRSVLADAVENHDVNTDKVLLSGFSRGGSMVWDIACHAPDLATAFAPMAGAFWDALPERCAAPVNLFHTHGWSDRTVPLEGRQFGIVTQGDVWASLFVMRETNRCTKRQPESSEVVGDRWYRYWTDCEAGSLQLMLHPGGHGAPKGWSAAVMDWFEGLDDPRM